MGVNLDSSDSASILNDPVVSRTAHDTASSALKSPSLTTELISDVDISHESLKSLTSLTNVAGVYAPIGFRSSSGARPVSFLGNRLSAIRVVEDT